MIVKSIAAQAPDRDAFPTLNTRLVPSGHHEVVDLLRERQPALVVCVRCGKTWDEGGLPPSCR